MSLRFLSAPALTLMAASAAQARSPLEVTAQVWYAERRERIVFVESAGFWWLEDPGQ
jgi:hypothetical protein